jgi:glycerol-1-phosphate dehydrogenase [NAD(P)+]
MPPTGPDRRHDADQGQNTGQRLRRDHDRCHGLQLGVAAYIVSRLQGAHTDSIRSLFETSDFWDEVRREPFSMSEWLEAARQAPTIKKGSYTVLSARDCEDEIRSMLENDAILSGCFIA